MLGRANAFAKFRVRGNTLQSSEIVRHCKSKLHNCARAALTASGLQPAASTESGEQPEGCGVATSAAEHVPRPEKFVWAIIVSHAAGSDVDYNKFCEAADLTSYLSSEGKMTDSSRRVCRQMILATGAVLHDRHQAILAKGQRLAFSIDERDQVFVMRVRIVVSFPRVEAHEFVAGLIRDYGHGVEEGANAAWACLEGLCTKRVGKRGPDGVHGPGDVTDAQLLRRLQDITFVGASDGCEVAILGIQSLRSADRLPRLRYQFRDRPHTTRSCVKNVLSYLAEGKDLLEAFVTGPHSFAKRARFSRRFQAIWKRRQLEDPEQLMNVLQDLSYKECRFDHRFCV